MCRFQELKAQVIARRLRKEHMVQEADRNRRLQLQVILTFVKLLLVQSGAVVEDALFVIAKGKHLHFHIELPARLVACLDVKDG